ncbi:GntR family transcriptional regulator [Neobacillus niacini]|uniref:GntR family transcriptional regulator n=1 Tax=Neobacillus niacini TaxID=86668 RepID=UPI00286D553D|nr:GntR family transcriptional regulator [Neobacillus niacini]
MKNPFQHANRRSSTKDFVYFEIKQRIIEGILEPNESISEENIATELNISRTPIREALQRLEIEELITRLPNGRLQVSPISIREVEEIYNVRSLLEGLVAREATLKANENDLKKLNQFTQLILEASENDIRDDVVFYGNEMHSYLYQISGNKNAVKILNQLNDHISRYRRLGPTKNNERSKKAAQEHMEIYEALVKKDPEKVEMLMRAHIHNSLEAAIDSIKKHLQKSIELEGNG